VPDASLSLNEKCVVAVLRSRRRSPPKTVLNLPASGTPNAPAKMDTVKTPNTAIQTETS